MRRSLAVVVLMLLGAGPAAAQSFELGGLVGFTPKASLDRKAPQFEGTAIDGGVSFGIDATWLLSEHWGLEGEWVQQFSGFAFEPLGGDFVRLYDITLGHIHGYATYRFGAATAKWRPFVFGGGGTTLFTSQDMETETKLSLGMGGGVIYALTKSIGIEGRALYRPTLMNDTDAGDFCIGFGYCQSTLQQFDFLGGIKIRF
jgi:opacity protein-like surface antigen